ncbi:hypothetical protein ABFU14_15850 [Xanthomonas campestris pv. raphani]|uniref:hypothetical protein n=1 Tax=Xanthomonas campestris TaxID=339 RepID=UPI00388EAA12
MEGGFALPPACLCLQDQRQRTNTGKAVAVSLMVPPSSDRNTALLDPAAASSGVHCARRGCAESPRQATAATGTNTSACSAPSSTPTSGAGRCNIKAACIASSSGLK